MLESIPPLLLQFIMTTAFSFIVGLEFHSYLRINQSHDKFGSIRTFVLIGLLGFLLYQLDTDGLFFAVGIGSLSVMLSVYYWRQTGEKHFSLLEILLALLVFLIGPVTIHFPAWFLVLFVVLLVLMLGEKPLIHQFSNSLATNEIVTLAKFLVISGVILPLLPDKQLAPELPITYYKVWLAVIIVSGFSYLSYLAQTYFFKTRGLLLTGLLGGLYSSTAISVVISRRAQQMTEDRSNVSSALIMATAMMYLRLLVIIFFLDSSVGKSLIIPFTTLIALSCIAVMSLLHFGNNAAVQHQTNDIQHPLELSMGILFALMFVFFAFITQYVISHYGNYGLNFLSVVVGFTDIDPFILSLLSGKFAVQEAAIVSAVIIASGSNNLLKAIYVAILARNRSVLAAFIWLLLLFVITLFYAFYFV
jgi:uncharacterized membrane protein (DUF4010 family)